LRLPVGILGGAIPCRSFAPGIKAYRVKAEQLWGAAERTGNPQERCWLIEAAERWEFAAESLEAQQRQLPLALY
jgi:hypothetical protein